MTYEETKQFLSAMRVYYPQSFIHTSPEDSKMLLDTWASAMANVPLEAAKNALKEIVMTDEREFAPNIAMIMRRVAKPSETMSGEEAWLLVRKTMRNYDWIRETDMKLFNKLPDSVKKCITFDETYNMAQSNPADNDMYVKPRFIKAFNQVVENTISETITNNQIAFTEKKSITYEK